MITKLKQKDLEERFESLYEYISTDKFLRMDGLGKEVPFFISSFPPEHQIIADRLIKDLINRLENKGIYIYELNLYDLSIELLENEEDLEDIIDKESSMQKDELIELLQSLLDTEDELMPVIYEKIKNTDFKVLFITGVGLVFPYIRSHNILNNLQKMIKNKPVVMFFPGEYSYSKEYGSSLDLFGLLTDDKYYRAFDLDKLCMSR